MSQCKTSWGWMFWRGMLSCRSAANTKETLIFSYLAWSLHIHIELGIFSCSLVVYGWELNSVFYLRSCTPSAWDIYSGSSGLWVSQFSEFLLCFFCVDTHLPLWHNSYGNSWIHAFLCEPHCMGSHLTGLIKQHCPYVCRWAETVINFY